MSTGTPITPLSYEDTFTISLATASSISLSFLGDTTQTVSKEIDSYEGKIFKIESVYPIYELDSSEEPEIVGYGFVLDKTILPSINESTLAAEANVDFSLLDLQETIIPYQWKLNEKARTARISVETSTPDFKLEAISVTYRVETI
jgi:hypothetical protein